MLIAEDLLLLATDDATGKLTVSSMQLDPGLAGAVLIELVVAGRVNLDGEGKGAKVVVIDDTPLGDPVLDVALQSLIEKGPLKPGQAISRLAKGLRDRVNDQLAERGILRRESGKVLGLFPTTKWPAQDSSYETGVQGQVAGALLKGLEPDGRTAAIISVLTAADMLKTVVEKPDLKAAKARGKEIGAGNWASDSVHKVIQETQAAMTAAVMVSTTAVVIGGSSSPPHQPIPGRSPVTERAGAAQAMAVASDYPPAIAPMTRNGSVPFATTSGSGSSGDSCDRSSSQA